MTKSTNSMTFAKCFMFHDFSMTTFIFQVFQSLWEPCICLLINFLHLKKKEENSISNTHQGQMAHNEIIRQI